MTKAKKPLEPAELTDEQLLAELDGADVALRDDRFVPMVISCARLDVCLKCEFQTGLLCTKNQPKGDSRLNISSAVKLKDVVCPVGKWDA